MNISTARITTGILALIVQLMAGCDAAPVGLEQPEFIQISGAGAGDTAPRFETVVH